MERTQKKAVKRLTLCFLIFFAIRVLEELVITPLFRNTMGYISCGGGIIILLLYIRYIDKPIEWIAFPFVWKKFRNGIGMAFILNSIPMVLVYLVEFLYYKSKTGFAHLSIYYDSVSHAYSNVGRKEFLLWMGVGLLTSLVHAAFYELTFRGLFFSLSAKTFKFGQTNALQSLLYVIWFMIPVLRVLAFSFNNYQKSQLINLVVFTIIYEFLTAYKLGVLRNASGSVWVCIFDHMAFGYILDILHIQANHVPTDLSLYQRMIAYQAVALILTIIYNTYKTKLRKQRAELAEESK